MQSVFQTQVFIFINTTGFETDKAMFYAGSPFKPLKTRKYTERLAVSTRETVFYPKDPGSLTITCNHYIL